MLTLHLFHGRNTPDEELSDWGFDGPTLLIGGFHCTYLTTYVVKCEDEEWHELSIEGGLLEYEGKYYGDWSINEKQVMLYGSSAYPWYDPKKTNNP
jgi:hypothetical protein